MADAETPQARRLFRMPAFGFNRCPLRIRRGFGRSNSGLASRSDNDADETPGTLAHLGLADPVHGGAADLASLSEAIGVDSWRLGRFTRFLTAPGLFRTVDSQLELTEIGQYLRREIPGSLHPSAASSYYLIGAAANSNCKQARVGCSAMGILRPLHLAC